MKNQNYKLEDLIRIWMKACFNRAMEKTGPEWESPSSRDKKSQAK